VTIKQIEGELGLVTVKEMWEKKNRYTRGASDIARTLCLSGLAVVWIFRIPSPTGSALPPVLIWVSALIVTALFLDLIQYVVGATRTGRVARTRELELKDADQPRDTSSSYPEDHAGLMNRIWGVKIAIVLIAWVILIFHILWRAITATLPAITP